MVTMIAAIAENNALGRDNVLLWHLPDDFKRFKALTTGHTIIMGRKTFESLPNLLPKRSHIIISRNKNYRADGVQVVHTMEAALAAAQEDARPFIIGGGEIYHLGLPYAQCLELTKVHQTFEADAFFPEFDHKKWKLTHEVFHEQDARHLFSFTFQTFMKI